jgi:3'(2'), 5'-bisphosphate nucleotidase
MSYALPSAFAESRHVTRLEAALASALSAGAGLLALRHLRFLAQEQAGQLKTSVDAAAEGWVLGFLQSEFAGDRILAEERHDGGQEWRGIESYWTVDALDGTRSYVDGFPTWCVQIAWIEDGAVCVGVVHEPAADQSYVAIRGYGAFVLTAAGVRQLRVDERNWQVRPRFIDSTPPEGRVAAVMRHRNGRFVECGSIGLKICRVADSAADLFIKPLRFKLWDVAPGDLVLQEAGGRVCTWDGLSVRYDAAAPISLRDILAAPAGAVEALAHDLKTVRPDAPSA